ncbi:unnamed protein product [Adineta steineri]|uniref:Uncharacterized protein n=1 Tax=Adineta steineri TaxID=433720 RepID=A0A820BUA7_9BILA|nr:unnamed protein product [Adineta steineri]
MKYIINNEICLVYFMMVVPWLLMDRYGPSVNSDMYQQQLINDHLAAQVLSRPSGSKKHYLVGKFFESYEHPLSTSS